jgi:hypothetical protein
VQLCPALVEPLLAAGANPRVGPEGKLPADVASSAAIRSVLHRAARWYDIRVFIWAYSRGQVGSIDADEIQGRRPSKMLIDTIPSSVVLKVLPFLTDIYVTQI